MCFQLTILEDCIFFRRQPGQEQWPLETTFSTLQKLPNFWRTVTNCLKNRLQTHVFINLTYLLRIYAQWIIFYELKIFGTGKSLSEALNLESVNPQYDKRLFIGFPEKYKLCTNIVLNLKTKNEKQFCTQHVLNLYISGNSMNNLLSYCGLTDA